MARQAKRTKEGERVLEPAALRRLIDDYPFPDPRDAEPEGLLAYGGDLLPERLLSAYAQGVFPWYESEPILWHSPDPRMVLLPEELRINRTLAKSLRRERFEVRSDSAFRQVIEACASTPRPGQRGTWITSEMIEAYCALHEMGFAHSVEAFSGDVLVGGVYGVSLGAAFFGESMFARQSEASKVAFVHLVRGIARMGFHFLDCQVHTEHTERLGARDWSRADFLSALERALGEPTRVGHWQIAPPAPSEVGDEPEPSHV
jgi:leucyl/phenylalanyl-tRNA--protein transferase